ncbi:MAG TPA: hypothetical protein VKR55_04065 [Bradyrhizobium sp.]|uniref:hypothetical protein n=1 Tax=Bradyrhizobium sp. TaxID=376 RepID=UPI002CFF0B79|nr:hypothetical protein [Bradyrhizobium sp.]HLZ01310.1 hypothetical protein [Bradyrhizobium sp.]
MDVSSVSATAPTTQVSSGDSKPQTAASSNGDNSTYQPPPKPPLPPGQGTRVDQLA